MRHTQTNHLQAENNRRYFGNRVAIGYVKKKEPPIMNQTIFMQKAMSVKSVTSKQTKKKERLAAVFLGHAHW